MFDSGVAADEILKSINFKLNFVDCRNAFSTFKVFSSPFNCSWLAMSLLINVAYEHGVLIEFFPLVIVIGTI